MKDIAVLSSNTMQIFDDWNRQKKMIHQNMLPEFYINPREIWYTKMGQNVGFEQNGKRNFERPVLVIKKVGNLFFVVALTSKGRDDNRFYHKFEDLDLQNPKYLDSSYAILSQVKVMDKRRFLEHVGHVSEQEFKQLKEKLKELLL